jgi:predicted MFS family arabinose efflux permease
MTSAQRSILAAAMLMQSVSIGLTFGILPVLLEPLELAFEASRTTISSGQILMMVALAMGSLLTGLALDRGYVRRVMLAGALLLTSAQVVAALSPNLWVLGLAAVMAGFAVPSVGPLAAASLVTRSFDAERGRALGLMSMGPALGSGFFAAMAGWSLLVLDWRQTFLFFAVIAFVVMTPVVWFFIPPHFDPAPDPASESGRVSQGVSLGALVRRPLFLWTAGVFALSAGTSSGWVVHVAAFLGGSGFDETQRSGLLALQYWMGVPGALFFGVMADRVGLTTLFAAMLGTGAACFGVMALEPAPVVVVGTCVVFGFAFGGTIPLYMLLLGRRLGPDAMGRAMGLSNMMMLPVMTGSVLLAASIFEATGGYTRALSIFSIALLGAIGCLLGSNWSARKA